MYTTPSYNQHILYGDALHNLKRKNYKTVCAEMSLAKVTLDRMVDFFNGICNFCFICSAARLSQYSKIALSKLCTATVYIVISEHYIYNISSSGVPFLYF